MIQLLNAASGHIELLVYSYIIYLQYNVTVEAVIFNIRRYKMEEETLFNSRLLKCPHKLVDE